MNNIKKYDDIDLSKMGLEGRSPETVGYAMALSKVITMQFIKEYGPSVLNVVFQELYDRKTLRADVVFTLHSWALHHIGLTKAPKYFPSADGEYIPFTDRDR